MELVWLVILLALVQYSYFAARVGALRSKSGIAAPKTVGDDAFERTFRVHQNTLEQLIVFIPGMLAFAIYVSPLWALLPGVVFLIGRQYYGHTYAKDAEKRAPGAIMTIFSGYALVLGGLIGIVIDLM